MCEGELMQVCERDNLDLLKERYIVIVKKKTAALFAASCRAGALVSNRYKSLQKALQEYGLNFGIAFQIIDDYLDLIGKANDLGKMPGQDVRTGEITLPILYLLESLSLEERKELNSMLTSSKTDAVSLHKIRLRLCNSQAPVKTKEASLLFINLAKQKIEVLPNSDYKDSLLSLADFIIERGFRKRP
jgi:geranylgeranyl pyrophosphate synthase